MPYIASGERPAIDARVESLAEDLSGELSMGPNTGTGISPLYRRTFSALAKTLLELESGTFWGKAMSNVDLLAVEIFGPQDAGRQGTGAWLGRFNYAVTRLIQVVPLKMVERGVWKEEFRYWVYAQTVGALTRAAMEINSGGGDDWAVDGAVGVLIDVKDEYKRRVNSAYEAVQIMKAGDAYTVHYRTEVAEVRDETGKVVGYREVMRDFRSTD